MHVKANTRVELHQWADNDIYVIISTQKHTKMKISRFKQNILCNVVIANTTKNIKKGE